MMSAEGMPQEKPSFIERPLLTVTRLVLRFPGTTLALGVLLAAAAMGLSQARLGFRTNRLDLLNPKSQFNQLWIEYIREFGDEEDVVVVVEGAGRDQVLAVRRELAAAIAQESRLFHSVLFEIDPARLQSKGLYYLPVERLLEAERFLDEAEPIVQGQWMRLNVGAMSGGMCYVMGQAADQGQPVPAELEEQLLRVTEGVQAALDGRYRSPWPAMPAPAESAEEADSRQFLAEGGRMGFVLLKLVKEDKPSNFVQGNEAIATLRRLIASARSRHPEAKIGLTGLPVIEHDEMASSENSMSEVGLLSFVGVSLLFVAGFGCWRHPLLAMTSLMVGTAWSMGYITLVIGHLNILSSAFAVILIGQGIDFSMYYVAQYMQLRSQIDSAAEALKETVRTVGPGVATGAVTTAVAFFMAGLTEFTGVAELGVIAGGGILLCWIAGLTVLPAMILLVDRRWPYRHVPLPVDVRSWLEPLFSRPKLLLLATSILTVLLTRGVAQLNYDHNLLHLQARGLESVELEKKLLSQSEFNASYALSIAENREDALARKARLLALPSVKRVEEIGSRFPEDVAAKQPIIERMGRRLATLRGEPPAIPCSPPAGLVPILRQAAALLAASPRGEAFCQRAEQVVHTLGRLPPSDASARLSAFQQGMAEDLLARLDSLRAVAAAEPPGLGDLPQSLVSRFISRNGRHLLRVYARGDVWDMDAMKQFVAEVRSIDPRATGNPMQIYEASRQMQQSYIEAAIYAMCIILPVVFLDFRNIRHTLLAVAPLGLGMLQMFGLMGLLGIPLNAANMIVLPLILGIGIDAGVHVVHDYCSQRGRYRINASTASAVVINSVTNMAGFGSLMMASHRGLQSLGRVLTLGLTCCLFTSLVMLPAVLVLWSRRREAEMPDEVQLPAAASLRRVDPAHPSPAPSHAVILSEAKDLPGTRDPSLRSG